MADHRETRPQSTDSASSSVGVAVPPARRSEFGAAVLTLALWALLIDMAVETFQSGAPVRWWVAGVASTYLLLTALLLWRPAARERFGWSRRATAALFVLIGLLALTAWLPGGLTNGVRMLRQPTSIVLSVVSALAVVGAGIVLIGLRLVPWWGRIALGILAL